MDVKTVCNTLRPLSDLVMEVAEINFHFESLLAEQIQRASKPLEDMTLTEINQLIAAANTEYQTQTRG